MLSAIGAAAAELAAAHLGADPGRTPRPSSCASTSATGPPNGPRQLRIDTVDPVRAGRRSPTRTLAEQLTAMAWTHRQAHHPAPHHQARAADQPNVLVTAEAAELGSADTTPDNLYMIGTFRLEPRRGAGDRPRPRPTPGTGASRWRTSGTSASSRGAGAARSPTPRCAPRARRHGANRASPPTIPATVNWLDTGGRHRGFVILRWLDNPQPPPSPPPSSDRRRSADAPPNASTRDLLIDQACELAGSDDFGDFGDATAGGTGSTGCPTDWRTRPG